MALENKPRVNFASVKNPYPYPDFLDVQLKSFRDFLQLDTPPEERKNDGLYKVFAENFPITDTRNNFVLEFLDYYVDPPRYSIDECLERGLTYSVPLKAKMKLYCTDPDHEDFGTFIQDVFLGTIPYMTSNGTFVINGAERVVVSQLHRSPGVFFGQGVHANGTVLYSARIIPFKGSWIEFATDINNVMYAYIDRKKKLPVTTMLRAIGYESDRDILQIFDLCEEVKVNKKNMKAAIGRKIAGNVMKSWTEDFVDEDTGEVVSIERNEVVVERETIITEDNVDQILDSSVSSILLHKDEDAASKYSIIFNTLAKDPSHSEIEAVNYIYRQLRNADAADDASAREVFQNLFFSDKRYDLGEVGRYRINKKLNLETDMDVRVLTKDDIIEIIKYLISLINSNATVDDIDHLSNRRVRTVGEQLANQFSVGLARMNRTIRERMNVRDSEVFQPTDLINAKTISSVINSFFGTNPLSQFMDQTNPLAEVTHKRRLSALGPGGLSRERAGFEVRDVHYTHYGRLCPIESPEGPNIGLISSLCMYAKINDLGFIVTPYRRVKDAKVDMDNKDVVFLTAEEEEEQIIGQGNAPLNADGTFIRDVVKCRQDADYPVVTPDSVALIDVSPQQIASVSAGLIPFLEHDDANRALMGANMQRQAVPCLRAEKPMVGTGIERAVAVDSATAIVARRGGVVEYVDANRVVVRVHDDEAVAGEVGVDIYNLVKFTRSNQSTNINQRPAVKAGDVLQRGDLVADGASTDLGELALGQNMVIAFMPWNGYNYEDSILISEKVAADDRYTSIHIEELNVVARDTKLGAEDITRDIPNLSERMQSRLDESGIVYIGAEVEAGDVLVGKVTPKGETQLTPEEKLLRAIFGEKASDVKDTSLRMPTGMSGTVIDVQVFTREGIQRDKRAQAIIDAELKRYRLDLNDQLRIFDNDAFDRIERMIVGQKANGGPMKLAKGSKITAEYLAGLPSKHDWFDVRVADENIAKQLELIKGSLQDKREEAETLFEIKKKKMTQGDELQPGVQKMVKVFIAIKRRLQAGDKMAGRHGNKGVVSRILPVEDMPYMADGRPVDIVLNPLGVPSRMNIGQILEVHLGWAAKGIGERIGRMLDEQRKTSEIRKFLDTMYNGDLGGPDMHKEDLSQLSDEEILVLAQNLRNGATFASPVFDGAHETEIKAFLDLAYPSDDPEVQKLGFNDTKTQITLYDGRSGEPFDRKVTVGVMHYLKLHHLVDEKMHARSTGPYSLVTQQPLGGKAQFGGQRFGEMEVWALEAYGAAYTLQEMLTVKSDDVNGRTKMYENIVKGEHKIDAGMPESFNVLVKEIRSLGLDIDLERH